MNHTTHSKFSRLLQVSLGVSALALSMAVQAQQTGPDPTKASLEKVGPLAVANVKVATPSGYGSGTVYYPTTGSAYGLVSVTPGFVEVTIGTTTLFDVPANRAKQMMAALKQVTALSATPTSPFAGKVDPSRLAVMGHSMGGGGSLNAARDNPTLKAAIPLAPWETNKDYSKLTVPTLIVSCDGDIIAPVADHANKFYASLTPTLNRALMEMKDAGHFCTNGTAVPATKTLVGKYSISWLKRFVDGDTRYSPFLCGAPHQADLGGTLISTYKDNCPY